jgi:hypothetical protein
MKVKLIIINVISFIVGFYVGYFVPFIAYWIILLLGGVGA